MTSNLETEFKLRTTRPVEVARLDALIRESAFTCRAARQTQHNDSYLDSADDALAAAGIGLRIRVASGGSRITCKRRGKQDNGLFVREEHEQDWPAPTTPSTARDLPETLRHIIEPVILQRPLRSIIRLQVQREIRQLDGDDGALCELALDHVTAHGAGRSVQFTELELEVADDLPTCEQLAFALRRRLELEPAPDDKPTHAGVLLGMPPALAPTPASHLQATMQRRLATLRRSETSVRIDGTPHAVHAMRVALRRLRAVVHMFPEPWPEEEWCWLDEHLRALGHELGRVRDCDVAHATLSQTRTEVPAALANGTDQVLAWLTTWRQQALTQLLIWLGSNERLEDSQRLHDLLLSAARRPMPDADLAKTAGRRLTAAVRRVRRRGRRLEADPGLKRLHRLRIQARDALYLIREFEDLLDPALAAAGPHLAQLKDLIGELCDHANAARNLIAWNEAIAAAHPEDGSALIALGALMQVEETAAAERLATARDDIRTNLPPKPPK